MVSGESVLNEVPAAPASGPHRLSEIVGSIDGRQGLSIGGLADMLGERAFGALMFIFAVPNVIPTPPGTSALLGLPLIFLTFQLMIGRQKLWLPDNLRRRAIKAELVESFVRRAVPVLNRLERVLRPRLSLLAVPNLAERIIGFVAFGLSVILFLPIPFANILPALAIAMLSLGLAERDGLAAITGYLLAGASVFVLVLVSSALYAAVMAFFYAMMGF